VTVTDLETAVAAFLRRADSVYDEYEAGYTDADAALRQLRSHVAELERETDRDGRE